MNKDRNKAILTVLICLATAFACITINSENSFLYAIQGCDDAQTFMTVARCMRRGDVLYRDIYEHKGLYLYLIYLLANIISANTFIGVYLVEIIFYASFLFFSMKTVRLFSKNETINWIFIAALAIRATSNYPFRGGGQCEELVLPLFAAAIWLAFIQFSEYGRKDLSALAFPIGVCFGIAFWMKYTLTGIYAGYTLAVLIFGIVKKDSGFVIKKALYFICGAFAASVPALAYFLLNGACGDMWAVYFQKLVFEYRERSRVNTAKILSQYGRLLKPYLIVVFVCFMCSPGKKISKRLRLLGLCMAVFSLTGNAVAVVQPYTHECYHAFSILGFVGLADWAAFLIDYSGDKRVFLKIHDLFVRARSEWEEKYAERFSTNKAKSVLITGALLYFFYMLRATSPYTVFMFKPADEYALVQMSNIMLEKTDNPKILVFDCSDHGLFNLTDTYPMDRMFCSYTMYTPEELGYYEKYIHTGKAEYVFSTFEQMKLPDLGYHEVFRAENTPFVADIGYTNYYLYAREDLATVP